MQALREIEWPTLPLSAWSDTRHKLHMYAQIIGKIRLHLMPPEPEWNHVPLYITARGLSTGPMPCDKRLLQIDVDLISHQLELLLSDGQTLSLSLTQARSVADFYQNLMEALHSLEIAIRISPIPVEIKNPIPFPEDRLVRSYDTQQAHRFQQILLHVYSVMLAHRAPFRGRHTPVQFFWGTFDLAYTRFSGRPANPPPNADTIMRHAMDAEEISAGFWPGDERFPEPAFFCYGYPKAANIEQAAIKPAKASWNNALGEFILRYEDVRTSPSPSTAIKDFLTSAYEACTLHAGWTAR